MYEISVVSYQGAAPADRIAAVFGADGGTIGRGPANTLVLPDPNRFVSRVQAKIDVAGERIAITNASSANPLLVNDREVDAGSQASLRDGDELRIGLYVLCVRRVPGKEDAAERTQLSVLARPPTQKEPRKEPASPRPGATPMHAPAPHDALQPGAGASRGALDPLQAVGGGSATGDALDPLQIVAGSGVNGDALDPLHIVADTSEGPLDPLQALGGASRRADPLQPAAAASGEALDSLQPVAGAPSSDPFADLIPAGSAIDGNVAARPAGKKAAPPASGAPAVPDQVWDELARMAPSDAGAKASPSPPVAADFDAFAAPSATTRNPDDPLAEFAHSSVGLEAFEKLDAPIDALFNDAPAQASVDDVIPNPHAIAPDPLATPESVDPIAIFGGDAASPPPQASERPEPDQVPELEAWFRPPQPQTAPAAPLAAAAPAKAASARPEVLPDRTPTAAAQSIAPTRETRAAPARSASVTSDVALVQSAVGRAPLTHDDAPLQPSAAGRAPLTNDALLQAFLGGAGIPNAIVKDGLTPQMMKAIGAMLATAVQGTIELIATRAMLKREVKADVTIISTTRNNPLKFLPDAESALLQMFGARIPGFMEPVEAMQDAYRDLRAHEVGLIAGMRAALAEVLRRFEPEELEKRLKPPGMLESILPNSHQARLWETFSEMYGDISREAQDDFQALFGKAFLQAYESEVARLKGP